MTEIKLFLDLNAEADNLYIETENSYKAVYQIFGFGPLEEEGHVIDMPQRITLEADGKNVLDSISEAESDYLLAANITTFEKDEVCIYEFENKKLNALEKVGEDLYEIRSKNRHR